MDGNNVKNVDENGLSSPLFANVGSATAASIARYIPKPGFHKFVVLASFLLDSKKLLKTNMHIGMLSYIQLQQ